MIDVVLWSVLLGAAAYRVGRFIVLDTMFEGTRDRVVDLLESRSQKLVFGKLLELTRCPFCISVWTSAATTLIADLYVGVALPVLVWAAASVFALMFWRIIDPE
jgi:hypothetical protein